MSAGFAQLRQFLRDNAGIVVEDDKRYFIEDRLRPVLRAAGLPGFAELARALQADRHSELARRVIEALTIHETSFFRDRALFNALSGSLLPQLLAARDGTQPIRAWCAGCSTGQEPYSVAMVFEECKRQNPGWRFDILATDLSRAVIEHARRGIYSQFEVQRGLPVAMLLRHFHQQNDAWQVNDDLRAKISFQTLNLMSLPPSRQPFDVIFCRNVLFYFDPDTKRRVLHRLVERLAPDGFLILGGAERINDLCPALEAAKSQPFVFLHAAASARKVGEVAQTA